MAKKRQNTKGSTRQSVSRGNTSRRSAGLKTPTSSTKKAATGKAVKKAKASPAKKTKGKGRSAEHIKKYWWKKGESGNPSGRPKGSVSLVTRLKKILMEPDPEDTTKTKGDRVVEALLERVEEGNIKAVIEVFDRIDGKVPQRIDTGASSPLEGLSDEQLDEIIGAGEDRAIELDDEESAELEDDE